MNLTRIGNRVELELKEKTYMVIVDKCIKKICIRNAMFLEVRNSKDYGFIDLLAFIYSYLNDEEKTKFINLLSKEEVNKYFNLCTDCISKKTIDIQIFKVNKLVTVYLDVFNKITILNGKIEHITVKDTFINEVIKYSDEKFTKYLNILYNRISKDRLREFLNELNYSEIEKYFK